MRFALCTERRVEATRQNDLIYNAVLPVPKALPAIYKTAIAIPIAIQEGVRHAQGPECDQQRLVPPLDPPRSSLV